MTPESYTAMFGALMMIVDVWMPGGHRGWPCRGSVGSSPKYNTREGLLSLLNV